MKAVRNGMPYEARELFTVRMESVDNRLPGTRVHAKMVFECLKRNFAYYIDAIDEHIEAKDSSIYLR